MLRFRGTVQALGPVDVASAVAWVSGIPWDVWPQQQRLADGQIRPAMVNNPEWQGFYAATNGIVKQCQAFVPRRSRPGQRLLSVLMPGHSIPPHVDKHRPTWWGRVHVPLMGDAAARFEVGGEVHHLEVGTAYAVNTLREHSVTNAGLVPRVHLLVDWEW